MQNKDTKSFSRENEILIKILSSYVCDKTFTEDTYGVDWKYICSLAMEQGLGSILYKALEKFEQDSNNISVDKKLLLKLNDYYQKSLFTCAARNDALSKISSAFENAGIDFIILKGAVIQGYYPSPELRVMSDIDFLIRRECRKQAKEVLTDIGITFSEANSYQDIYRNCNGVIIEIHHELWGYNLEKSSLYSNIWNKSNIVRGRKHTYLLSGNDLYVFTIAHLFKHFCDSGIGIRPLFDIWYIFKKTISSLDFPYIKSELATFNAVEFEKNVRNLVNCIFLGKEKSDEMKLLESYFLRGKTHGSNEIAAINAVGDKSKLSHVISRIFPSLSYMKRRYGVLEKFPIFLPFFWIFRIVCLPFNSDRLNKNVIKIKMVNDKDREYITAVFEAAGIKKGSKSKNLYIFIPIIIAILFSTVVFTAIFFQDDSFGMKPDDNKEETISVQTSEETNVSTDDKIYGTIFWRGGTYIGYLVDDIPNGTGEHFIENTLRYVGVFVDGEYKGHGKIEYSDGSYFEGLFDNNQPNGEGTLYCANGDIINGIFTDGNPGGFCNYEYSDGNLFIGTMLNGLKHGEGTFYWLNGDKYEGSFIDDKRDGYGVLTYSNGDVYSGSWIQGFCSGYGVYTWSNGRKYEGNFENGLMNDEKGKITYPDGSVYVGEISDGLQNGAGELTYANGDIAKGKFSGGYLSGQADYYFFDKKLWIKVIYEKGIIVKYILD